MRANQGKPINIPPSAGSTTHVGRNKPPPSTRERQISTSEDSASGMRPRIDSRSSDGSRASLLSDRNIDFDSERLGERQDSADPLDGTEKDPAQQQQFSDLMQMLGGGSYDTDDDDDETTYSISL